MSVCIYIYRYVIRVQDDAQLAIHADLPRWKVNFKVKQARQKRREQLALRAKYSRYV